MAISRRGVLISTVGLLRYACRRSCLAIPSSQLLLEAVSCVLTSTVDFDIIRDDDRVTIGHQSPLRAYKHGWFAQASHGNTIIAAARACMLQPPEGGQAAIPSLQQCPKISAEATDSESLSAALGFGRVACLC